jgi:hypothetical protein
MNFMHVMLSVAAACERLLGFCFATLWLVSES